MDKIITVSLSGASGMPYGLKLIKILLQKEIKVNLIISDAAKMVLLLEMNINFSNKNKIQEYFENDINLNVLSIKDWTAPIASGSGRFGATVICPCSMKTLSAIACGFSDDLITRSADVAIKENKPLIIVPRETPLSPIHLENMLKLSRMGVVILPPQPGFYNKPSSVEDIIDFVVGKILNALKIENNLIKPWGE